MAASAAAAAEGEFPRSITSKARFERCCVARCSPRCSGAELGSSLRPVIPEPDGSSERRPRRAAEKHRGPLANKLTVSKKLARPMWWGSISENNVRELNVGVSNREDAPVKIGRGRWRWWRGCSCRQPAWLHHVSALIHVVTHTCGWLSLLIRVVHVTAVSSIIVNDDFECNCAGSFSSFVQSNPLKRS